MPKVKCMMGRTINIGNYENVKLDFGVELDCEEKDLDDKWAEAKKFVEEKIEEEEFRWKV